MAYEMSWSVSANMRCLCNQLNRMSGWTFFYVCVPRLSLNCGVLTNLFFKRLEFSGIENERWHSNDWDEAWHLPWQQYLEHMAVVSLTVRWPISTLFDKRRTAITCPRWQIFNDKRLAVRETMPTWSQWILHRPRAPLHCRSIILPIEILESHCDMSLSSTTDAAVNWVQAISKEFRRIPPNLLHCNFVTRLFT